MLAEWKGWKHLNELPLEAHYGLRGHCASVRAPDLEPAVVAELTGLSSPEARTLIEGADDTTFRALLGEARKAIDEDGADTIVLASLTMREAGAYLRKRLEVPVIDPGPLAFAHAEMLVELGLSHARRAYVSR